MAQDFRVEGRNAAAPFTLTLHRGEGMVLIAMNWRNGRPPDDFVGFGIQFREPGDNRMLNMPNRLGFPDSNGNVDSTRLQSMVSPIQKFRWVHFPFKADLPGPFLYRGHPGLHG